MIPRGSESRQGTRISLIAVHTAEGATTATSLEHYLDQPSVEASYHRLVDDTQAIHYLPDDVAAWAMLSGNHRAVQLCFTGFAAWPRSEWLAHDTMLRLGAGIAREWCARYGIPAVKLTPAQVGADASGVMGHWDWTLGKKDGTHTDPGPNFPWPEFMSYVNLGGPPTPPASGPESIPFMARGETSDAVRQLQAFTNRVFHAYSNLPVTGFYGPMTQAVIREFQRRVGIMGGDGANVGVITRSKLYEYGFRYYP
jgi:N-acetyl-anhydromuramyl-L-alanine amidase AmpD